ncbi:hypothetical protein [Nocardia inohanensis]|uniref:hypothetical protein n=1 Tax=Nocardia inohanensis TaxID=209246 RepID=UPI00082BE6FE|nr:hypothetical protein [Nocardia inohanensis]
MGQNVEADPVLLSQAAAKTTAISDAIKAVLTGLEAAVDGRGTPWGHDKPGNLFANGEDGNGYVASRQNLAKLTADTTTNTGEQGGGQGDAAKLLQNRELSSADGFRSINGK